MQHALYAYLIHHGRLPLVGLPALSLEKQPAHYNVTTRQLHPPTYSIVLAEGQPDMGSLQPLMAWVSQHTGLTEEEAYEAYQQTCAEWVSDLNNRGEAVMAGLGRLKKQSQGVVFEMTFDAKLFWPVLEAERVVHPGRKHAIRVGDNETESQAQLSKWHDDVDPVGKSPTDNQEDRLASADREDAPPIPKEVPDNHQQEAEAELTSFIEAAQPIQNSIATSVETNAPPAPKTLEMENIDAVEGTDVATEPGKVHGNWHIGPIIILVIALGFIIARLGKWL